MLLMSLEYRHVCVCVRVYTHTCTKPVKHSIQGNNSRTMAVKQSHVSNALLEVHTRLLLEPRSLESPPTGHKHVKHFLSMNDALIKLILDILYSF